MRFEKLAIIEDLTLPLYWFGYVVGRIVEAVMAGVRHGRFDAGNPS